MDPSVLARKQLTELKGIAAQLQMRGYQRLRKADLIQAIVAASHNSEQGGPGAGAADRGDGAVDASRSNGGARVENRPPGFNGSPRPVQQRARDEQPNVDRAGDETAQRREDTRPREDGGQLRLGDEQRPSGEGDGEATRTRVRTRTRDRGADETRSDDTGDAASASQVRAVRRRARTVEGDGGTASDGGRAEPEVNRERGDESGDGAQGDGRADDGGRARDGDEGRQQERREGPEASTASSPGPAAPAAGPRPGHAEGAARSSDEEDGGPRRRRSRRERRRNKQQQGPQGRYREDDQPSEPGEVRSGVLDILPEGYGFLRTSGYLPGDRDVYVSQSQVRRHGLRRGDIVEGPIRQQRSNEKVPALHHVEAVNGYKLPEDGTLPHRPDFKDMTPLFPDERLRLETPGGPISMRIVDLMSPVGKGQRGLVVSPPKAGKTTILKELGQAISYNNPEAHLMVVLVDERPEEVTDMQRSVPGEIVASTFDRPADDHTQIAELAMERAKRLVEMGRDVVVLLDSITRLARAYNLAAPASGRIMSGGVDSTALYPPKRFFGAARNIEGGGSLTIIATALIETGSKMDEVIFEEFKGTGNMELRLDRKLEQKRVFPAIDIDASGTRKEELLLDREELMIIWKLRRVLSALEGPAALELLIDKMKQTRSNNQFLLQIQKSNSSLAS